MVVQRDSAHELIARCKAAGGTVLAQKSAQQLITELDQLYALGWRDSIFLVDDNFIGNKKLIKEELLPALIELIYIRAFFHSIYLLGIKGVERPEYWKLFFWTLRYKPRLFPQAITMTIYGYHFRTLADRI